MIDIKNRKYGWKKDKLDNRDFKYKAIAPKIRVLPNKIDLTKYCSIVEDQGYLGSCVANALAGNMELLEKKNVKNNFTGNLWQNFCKWIRSLFVLGYKDTSRLFIYYNARAIDGAELYDDGTYIRNGIKTLAKDGHCLESLWPYDINNFATKPNTEAYGQAKDNLIVFYFKLESIDDMLTCLADGYPFVFGMYIYDGFYKAQFTGIVDMPKPEEKELGGHAVMAVGYDKTTQRFIVRNSWGPTWGNHGYFTIPFEYIKTLAEDFWTIRK